MDQKEFERKIAEYCEYELTTRKSADSPGVDSGAVIRQLLEVSTQCLDCSRQGRKCSRRNFCLTARGWSETCVNCGLVRDAAGESMIPRPDRFHNHKKVPAARHRRCNVTNEISSQPRVEVKIDEPEPIQQQHQESQLDTTEIVTKYEDASGAVVLDYHECQITIFQQH